MIIRGKTLKVSGQQRENNCAIDKSILFCFPIANRHFHLFIRKQIYMRQTSFHLILKNQFMQIVDFEEVLFLHLILNQGRTS